jgi:hypothetical protein
MKSRIFIGCCIFFLLLEFGCRNGNPIASNIQPITLTIEDVSCTEVWLKISVDNVTHPAVTLERNTTIIDTLFMVAADTTIVDTSVKAGQTYCYTARLLNSSFKSTVRARTLDSTSNAINWYADTLGTQGLVRDVWVFDKNSALAVGQILLNNTNGQADMENPYGIARWNGQNWQLQKIYDNNNQIIPELRGIFSFNGVDIWLADGGVYHWDGISSKMSASYSRISLIGGVDNGQSINKLWGTSSYNLYGVGDKGMIAHYNGSSWQKMESGTTVDLNDIFGLDANHIWAIGTMSDGNGTVILSFDGMAWKSLYQGNYYGFNSVWTNQSAWLYITCDSGPYQFNLKTKSFIKLSTPSQDAMYCVRATGLNDVFFSGQNKEITNYNGSTWKLYTDVQALITTNAWWLSVKPTNDFVAVGGGYYMGYNFAPIVLRGYR